MCRGLCPQCGAEVEMHSDHDGDPCSRCGYNVKFRVQGENGRLTFLAGALVLFTIGPDKINTYERTLQNFSVLGIGELEDILARLDQEIAVSTLGTSHAKTLEDSRQAVSDLISAKTSKP